MRNRAGVAIRLFGVMCFVYALLRLAFLLIYFENDAWPPGKLTDLFYHGFRVDIAALFYINLPFLAWYFFIDPFIQFSWKNKVSVVLFSLVNLAFLALNFLDLVYYRYNHRRSTIDLLDVFSDSSSAFNSFFSRYWYVLLVFTLVCIAIVQRVKKIIARTGERRSTLPAYFITSLMFLGIIFIIARGWSKRPLQPSSALLYMDARYQPLLNNSTFNFLFSVVRKQTTLEKKTYFTGRQLDSLFSIYRQYPQGSPFQKRNVVFFVLESFSKEFFKGYPLETRMPFFDSLMQHSTVFDHAFANALESNKGLPAILASLPDVMDEPLYLSNYSNIPFKGIGSILKEEGYNTSFFMGAEYDHFGFTRLCKSVGIDEYYSRDTYGKHKNQYDGTWGIYDEYFFRYFADVIGKKQQPFFSVLFNLSSHSPYKIPETANWLKVPGQADHQNSITYVDHSFQKLFDKIKSQPWFSNTIFVFVADHGYRYTNERNQVLREMQVPLFIYDPRQPVRVSSDRVVKQLDIVPSLLDKLHYSKPFTSFGTSFYRPEPAFSVNRLNGMYHYIDSTDLIGYDDVHDRILYQYKWKEDPGLLQDQLFYKANDAGKRVILLKALLQRMNNSLTDNKLD
jgi:phosphoglycerol transferase MdoB-like AlkP superfamily enzyme